MLARKLIFTSKSGCQIKGKFRRFFNEQSDFKLFDRKYNSVSCSRGQYSLSYLCYLSLQSTHILLFIFICSKMISYFKCTFCNVCMVLSHSFVEIIKRYFCFQLSIGVLYLNLYVMIDNVQYYEHCLQNLEVQCF